MAGYPTDIINAPDAEGGSYDDPNVAVIAFHLKTDGTALPERFRIFADGRSHGQPAVDTFNWLFHS